MKKIIVPLAALLAAASLAGCGAKEVNVSELSAALLEGVTYSETLTEISADVTEKRLGIDPELVEECSAYAGTRAVVDEIAVLKTKDTDTVSEKVREHVASQIESYTSYRPDEVPKLNDAVIYTYEDTVILCISEDSDAAQQIISDYTN